MNRLGATLRSIGAALDSLDQRWAVVGGLAVSVQAEPRFTRDVDLAVAVGNDSEAEALVQSLLASGYQVLAVVEQKETSRLATARLLPRGEQPAGLVVDLLFASSGIEDEIVAGAKPLLVMPGLVLPVATRGHLIALKVLSVDVRRPQDAGDLKALLEVAEGEDLDVARTSLQLITQRGFDRGYDLEARFREQLERFNC